LPNNKAEGGIFLKPTTTCCHICREEISLTDDVVFDGLLKGVEHSSCTTLPGERIADRGAFEEVIMRNKKWLKNFYLYAVK
jgi:hypothetical protein